MSGTKPRRQPGCLVILLLPNRIPAGAKIENMVETGKLNTQVFYCLLVSWLPKYCYGGKKNNRAENGVQRNRKNGAGTTWKNSWDVRITCSQTPCEILFEIVQNSRFSQLNTWDFPPWLKTVGGYKLTMIHWLVQLLGTPKHQHPPF